MKTLMTCLLTASVLLGHAAAGAQPVQTPAQIAIRLLDHMDAGAYDKAEAMFDKEMAAAVPADKLRAVWESLPAQAGAATGRGEPVVRPLANAQGVVVPLHYEKIELVAQVVVTPEGKVSGFLVQPATREEAQVPPPEADAAFVERDIAIGTGERALPATLALPKSASRNAPVAAVVLVHGSGAHDRNETIGPNRPFLDIARGLAARDIAVLRYDKRSRVRPQDFAGDAYTIDDETTNDAVAAVAALAATDGVDPGRIFVLGHSQGGMLAPRIAKQSGNVEGLILLAAPARPLLDILIEQNRRLAVLGDGKTSDAERTAIAALEAQVRAARTEQDAKADVLPLGLPASYWRSTDAVDPVAEAQQVALPVLVLQGARDIQVVDADWQLWKRRLRDAKDATFKLYPALNHLGMAGEGEGSLDEYMRPGQVDAQLIGDVAEWIGRR